MAIFSDIKKSDDFIYNKWLKKMLLKQIKVIMDSLINVSVNYDVIIGKTHTEK